MIAIGFLLFTFLMYRHPGRSKIISNNTFLNMIFVGLVAAIIGGRVLFVLTGADAFSQRWIEVFYPWIGGFSLLGSVIAVLLVVPIYLKVKKIAILPVLDITGIYAPLLQAIARIGCFLAGCCYGIPATSGLWWSVVFKNVHGLAPLNVSLHPTQLYSSLVSLLIFLIIYLRARYLPYKSGQILFTYLFLATTARFIIDFWRGDRDLIPSFSIFKPFAGFLSYSQLVACFIFLFSLIGFIYVSKKGKIPKSF